MRCDAMLVHYALSFFLSFFLSLAPSAPRTRPRERVYFCNLLARAERRLRGQSTIRFLWRLRCYRLASCNSTFRHFAISPFYHFAVWALRMIWPLRPAPAPVRSMIASSHHRIGVIEQPHLFDYLRRGGSGMGRGQTQTPRALIRQRLIACGRQRRADSHFELDAWLAMYGVYSSDCCHDGQMQDKCARAEMETRRKGEKERCVLCNTTAAGIRLGSRLRAARELR